MYFILLTFSFLLLLLVFRLFRKDFAEPAVILCAYFAAALVLAFSQYEYWHLYEYSTKAGCILVTGVSSFVVGCLAARFFRLKSARGREQRFYGLNLLPTRIDVDKRIVFVCTFQAALTLVLFLFFFHRNVSGISLAALMNNFEEKGVKGAIKFPLYLNVLMKFNEAVSYDALLVLLYNSILTKLRRSDFPMVIMPTVYAIISLLMTNRGNLLQLTMGGMCGWYILLSHLKRKPTFRTVIKTAVVVIIPAACLFWMVMLFRSNSNLMTMNGFGQYMASYASGSFSALDLYVLQDTGKSPEWFGQETFVVLNNNLHFLFGLKTVSARFLEFRSGYGRSVVNIYTGFRRYYHDFRMAGVVILPFFQGLILSMAYHIRWKRSCGIPFSVLCYCNFIYTVPYLLIEDFFYTAIVSISGLGRIVIIYLTYRFFFANARFSYRL